MIDYKRSSWYGWSYLPQHLLNGSVLPKALPTMIFAALLGGWAASPVGISVHPAYDLHAGDSAAK